MKELIKNLLHESSVKMKIIGEKRLEEEMDDETINEISLAYNTMLEVIYTKNTGVIKTMARCKGEITDDMVDMLWIIKRLIEDYEERMVYIFKSEIEKSLEEKIEVEIDDTIDGICGMYSLENSVTVYITPRKEENKIRVLDDSRDRLTWDFNNTDSAINLIKSLMQM